MIDIKKVIMLVIYFSISKKGKASNFEFLQ